MNRITVKIKFLGSIAIKTGVKELFTSINVEREKGLEDINRVVIDRAGEQILFMILINGSSIYLNKSKSFCPDDEFSVVPIVLGG